MDYVKDKATPQGMPHPPLEADIGADAQTKTLWIESMRAGSTMGQAWTETRMRMEAFWLVACSNDAAQIPNRVRKPRAVSWTAGRMDPHAFSRSKGFGKGTSKSKGKGKGKKGKDMSKGIFPPAIANQKKVSNVAGKTICRLYNEGKCASEPCPKGFLHVCDAIKPSGEACGGNHRRYDTHSDQN